MITAAMVDSGATASRPARATKEGRKRPADKFEERRNELAVSALTTLAELGYTRTSLREIAQNSSFSHGVVHYYFDDKIDLITYCVRSYKAQCVTRYDGIVASAKSAAQLRTAFADKLAETLQEEVQLHRLWYDLRSQSLFEPLLREDVGLIDETLQAMVWRVVQRYAELAGRELAVDSATAYALLDGLFEQAVLAHTAGRPTAATDLTARAAQVLPMFLVA